MEAVLRKPFHQPFESVRDVSFSVPFGETFGIIGENGAGKSTVLKMLAGTLTPTSGTVVKRGRVSALLELGAGFHSEFTGRQNIYLNASLQGLSGSEIARKENAILDFAELGDFIDRPLKTYSSGMKVRLAFALATSVDPDILIVDEALSVGDLYFQKKCIDRMMAFKAQGKGILLCTHAMFLVNQLCNRAMWLKNGTVERQGAATHVTAAYEDYSRDKTSEKTATSDLLEPEAEKVNPPVIIRNIRLNDQPGPIHLGYREDLNVSFEYESFDSRPFWIAAGIRRNDDLICHAVTMARDADRPLRGKGIGNVLLRYPSLRLLHGEFSVVGMILDESGIVPFHRKESSTFAIVPPKEWQQELGLVDLEHEWKVL